MKYREIRTLLAVLATGIIAALLLAFGMLRIYNPEGTYSASNLLLAPDAAFSLSFAEPAPKGKAGIRFRFKALSLTHFSDTQREWITTDLTKQQYEAIYAILKSDASLEDPSSAIASKFAAGHRANLRLLVQESAGEGAAGASRTFTEASFAADGDHYRISLRHSGSDPVWVYFYHPGIYREMLTVIGGVHEPK